MPIISTNILTLIYFNFFSSLQEQLAEKAKLAKKSDSKYNKLFKYFRVTLNEADEYKKKCSELQKRLDENKKIESVSLMFYHVTKIRITKKCMFST